MLFCYCKNFFQLLDLPSIIESMKTVDKKTFYKTADICQVSPSRKIYIYALDNFKRYLDMNFTLNQLKVLCFLALPIMFFHSIDLNLSSLLVHLSLTIHPVTLFAHAISFLALLCLPLIILIV